MPYCENCGTQVNPDAKFCRTCGAKQNNLSQPAQAPIEQAPVQPAPVQPATYVPPPVQPQVQAVPSPVAQPAAFVPTQPQVQQKTSSGQVIGVIVLKKPKSFGRWDTFTGVLTADQFITAQVTNDMIKNATNEARDQAKAEGKGFFGQWSEQMKASTGFTKRYYTMDPAAIIAETPGNFAINNINISEIKLKLKHINNDYDSLRKEWEVEIHSSQGKYEFKMDENNEFVDTLKKAYAEKVKIPFGQTPHGINIKLF